MGPIFREDKATQLASRFVHAEGGEMDILKLVKLVYLTDRRSLAQHGRPVTFDRFYLMKHGPVVSSTMDCINAIPEDETTPYWSRFIGPRDEDHKVRLLRNPVNDQMSDAEEVHAEAVYGEFGAWNKWKLRDYTHTLPEWKDPSPDKKRIPLKYRDLLRATGWHEEDIEDLLNDLRAEITADLVLG